MSDRNKFLFSEYKKEYPLNNEREKIYTTEISHLYELMDMILNDLR